MLRRALFASRPPRRFTTRALSSFILRSPHSDVQISPKTVFVDWRTDPTVCQPQCAHLGLTHEAVTFKELYDSAKRIAVGLAGEGVRKGDVVLVHSLNCLEYPPVLLALSALGAVCSPVSIALTANDIARQARLSSAKYVVTHRSLEQTAIDAVEIAGIPMSNVYTIGGSSSQRRLKSINEVMSRGDLESFEFEHVDPELPAYLPFSSGTTGLPKGVILRARNLVANVLQVDHIEDFGEHLVATMPFYHIYPVTVLNLALYQGTTSVVLPRFELESFLDVVTRYKAKKATISPSIGLLLAHHPLVDKYDLSATKYLISAGAPMGKEVEALLNKRLGVQVKQAYGLTETSPAVHYTEDGFCRPGSVGRIAPNTELRVECTVTGKDLPPNQNGELLYRGPQVFLGYLANEEATQKTLMPDGFVRTGDFGYIDEDGFVFVIDRLKELIKYGGEHVPPAELEDILNHHPKIADSCAVRGFGDLGEELPKAYVVRKDPSLTEEDVMAFVASKVASCKQIGGA